MLESYESIIPTAILTSYPRIFTDIMYEKDIYNWIESNCSSKIKLNKSLAPEIEARYKLINKLLDKLNIYQVLEIASGYSSRGLIYSKKGYNYVEMDLPDVSNIKKKLIDDLFESSNNLHIVSGNAISYDDYIKCDEYFDSDKELVVINEGLFRYLTFDEKKKVGQNIYSLLKKHGGVWITCDITPKGFIDKQDKINPSLDDDINSITSRNNLNDRFESKEHVRSFFEEIGFKDIEFHKFIEVKDELKSFEILGLDSNSYNELLDSALVAVFKI